MNNVTTRDSVAALQREMDQAHGAFSDRHAETENANKTLQQTAQKLAALVAHRRQVGREVGEATRTAIERSIENPKGKFDASKIVASRTEAAILDSAIRRFRVFDCGAAERAHLAGTVQELEAQLRFEGTRLEHHQAQVDLLLTEAVALDGSIKLSGAGEITDGLKQVCHDISDRLQRAREALQTHDKEAAETRARYEEEEAKHVL